MLEVPVKMLQNLEGEMANALSLANLPLENSDGITGAFWPMDVVLPTSKEAPRPWVPMPRAVNAATDVEPWAPKAEPGKKPPI